jgi:DNA ligase-1
VLLRDVLETSAIVRSTSARTGKVSAIAELLARATPEEAPIAVAYLSGRLRQRQTGVGWAVVRDLPAEPAGASTLTLAEVDAAWSSIASISGPGAVAERRRRVGELFARATEDEWRLLTGLLGGELRQGAQEGVAVDAVARAAGVPRAAVARGLMLHGDLGDVAAIALADGESGLAGIGLRVGRPVHPMLAGSAPDVETAMAGAAPAAVDWKLDGIRVQVHRSGGEVRVFTRTLDDITRRVPEIVGVALGLRAGEVVLDGEAIALYADGRPRPFQETSARLSSRIDVAAARAAVPLSARFFDVLHLDGKDLLDRPAAERFAALDALLAPEHRVERTVADTPQAAAAAFDAALAAGHEGVVIKALDATYAAGRRGSGWLKVKPRITLDLVVLAAEWGHGRRRGRLSNLHLGARDPAGGFVMLGKTFKGLTDAMLEWQTEHLLGLATDRDDWVVRVRPELVVEIAFDGIQTSSRYPGGVALRFARVLRHRPDKTAAEADTIDAVRAAGGGGQASR